MNKLGRQRYARRLILATSDILQATRACELLLQNVKSKSDPLFVPLLTAIVVMYARPFVSNNRFGPLTGKWHEFTDPKFKQIHDTLIDLRHIVYAHSDPQGRAVVVQIEDTPLYKMISEVTVVSQSLTMEIFPTVLATCQDLFQRLQLAALEEQDCLA